MPEFYSLVNFDNDRITNTYYFTVNKALKI